MPEALQMLKFSFRRSRLSFTDSIITNEADYVIDGLLTEEELDNLLLEGEYDEIERMARDSSWVFTGTFSGDLAAFTVRNYRVGIVVYVQLITYHNVFRALFYDLSQLKASS
jgi:hypothetical protein